MVLIAAALVACGQSGPADTIAELPLTRGFYVMSDTACGDASSATLLLVRSAGMNGSRDACDFNSVEQTGPTRYRADMTCKDNQGRDTGPSTHIYDIPDTAQFSYRTEDSDYQSHFRFCEQSSLPFPWRDNDLSDLIGERRR